MDILRNGSLGGGVAGGSRLQKEIRRCRQRLRSFQPVRPGGGKCRKWFRQQTSNNGDAG